MDRFSQVGSLQDKLSIERLDQLICGLSGLCAWAPAAASVLDMLSASGDSADRSDDPSDVLCDIVCLDPAITAGLLMLANENRGKAPTSIRTAIEKLTFESVQAEMLAGRGFVALPGRENSADGFDSEAFNRHCLAVAVAAEKLAAFGAPRLDPDQAFMCGLLHDIGKLVLVGAAPKSHQRAIDFAASRQGNISEYERDIIGVDHSVAGLHLARQWRLGPAIEAVTWLSHQPIEAIPDSIADGAMVRIVALADTIARECDIGFSGNYQFVRSSERLAFQMGLAADIPARIAETLCGEVDELLGPLSASARSDGGAYYRSVLRANAKLGQLNRQLRNGAGKLQEDSDALAGVRELAASISPDALLPEILGAITKAACGATAIEPSQAEPIIAYCCQQDTDDVVLLVCVGADRPSVSIVRRNPRFSGESTGQVDPTAAGAMGRVLADIDQLRQWIDPGIYEHYRLVCDGAWIGGLLGPDRPDGSGALDQNLDAMSEVLSLTLAMARGQSRARRLSEQLAGAGQVLAATQETLAEARTLAAMGEMAAGAGHELNNPLTVISGRAQLMTARASSDEERKTWTQIADQAHRISDIITDLMDFASPRRAEADVVDVDVLTAEVQKEFSASEDPLIRDCEIVVRRPSEPLSVIADVAQIRAAVREVVTNAAIAGGAAGDRTIRISSQATESGEMVLISVSDNGPGMDARTLSSVFTPFFSAQEAGRRVGLGLPRAQRYVMNSGGRIWIKSQPGEGTTVFIELPRAD